MQKSPTGRLLGAPTSLFGRLSLRSKLSLLFVAIAVVSVIAVAFAVHRISGNGPTAEAVIRFEPNTSGKNQ